MFRVPGDPMDVHNVFRSCKTDDAATFALIFDAAVSEYHHTFGAIRSS